MAEIQADARHRTEEPQEDPGERRLRPFAISSAVAVAAIAAVTIARGREFVRARGTMFVPDQYDTLLWAISAAHFRQGAGPWSRLGMYHPGPMWFYWAAPFVTIAGSEPSSLVLAALALTATSLIVSLLVVWHRSGPAYATVAAIVLSVAVIQLGLNGLSLPWNPTILILPVTAGLCCAAVTLDTGSAGWAAVGTWCGAMVAQSHLGALLLGTAIVGLCLAGVVGARKSSGIQLLAVALVALVPWVPVLADQVVGHQNASALIHYSVTGEVSPRFPPVADTAQWNFDLSPSEAIVRQAEVTALLRRNAATWGGADLASGSERRPDPASLLVMVALAGVALLLARPRHLRPAGIAGFHAWLARVSLLGLAIEALAAVRVRGEFRYYLVASSSGVGVALWLTAALGTVHFVSTRSWWRPLPGPVRNAMAVATGLVLVGLAIAQLHPPAALSTYRNDHHQPSVDKVEALTKGRSISLEIESYGLIGPAQRLTIELIRRGLNVHVEGPFASHFSDMQQGAQHGQIVRVAEEVPPASSTCLPAGTFNGAQLCVQPQTVGS